jgi:O-antigen ligase
VAFASPHAKRLIIFVSVVCFLVGLSLYDALSLDGLGGSSFLHKIVNSMTELSFLSGYTTQELFTNWRGFEASMAWRQYAAGEWIQQLFGYGLGATVNLGQTYFLSTKSAFSELPILHNAYFQILIKWGAVGLLCYVWLVVNIGVFMANAKSEKSALRIAMFFVGFVLVSSLFVTGLLNPALLDALTVVCVAVAVASHREKWEKALCATK